MCRPQAWYISKLKYQYIVASGSRAPATVTMAIQKRIDFIDYCYNRGEIHGNITASNTIHKICTGNVRLGIQFA